MSEGIDHSSEVEAWRDERVVKALSEVGLSLNNDQLVCWDGNFLRQYDKLLTNALNGDEGACRAIRDFQWNSADLYLAGTRGWFFTYKGEFVDRIWHGELASEKLSREAKRGNPLAEKVLIECTRRRFKWQQSDLGSGTAIPSLIT